MVNRHEFWLVPLTFPTSPYHSIRLNRYHISDKSVYPTGAFEVPLSVSCDIYFGLIDIPHSKREIKGKDI